MDIIEKWLKQTIIGLNLCPFAKDFYQKNQITLYPALKTDAELNFKDVLNALDEFQNNSSKRTLLLYFPKWQIGYLDFLDFSSEVDDILGQLNLQDEFQIVVFHPEFYFEGIDPKDVSNLVNRSPYPLLHFIKKVDLDLIELTPQEAEKISFDNSHKIKNLSEKEHDEHFPWIYSKKDEKS
jgi:hypothetical protein